jgi:hypothetical protein
VDITVACSDTPLSPVAANSLLKPIVKSQPHHHTPTDAPAKIEQQDRSSIGILQTKNKEQGSTQSNR